MSITPSMMRSLEDTCSETASFASARLEGPVDDVRNEFNINLQRYCQIAGTEGRGSCWWCSKEDEIQKGLEERGEDALKPTSLHKYEIDINIASDPSHGPGKDETRRIKEDGETNAGALPESHTRRNSPDHIQPILHNTWHFLLNPIPICARSHRHRHAPSAAQILPSSNTSTLDSASMEMSFPSNTNVP